MRLESLRPTTIEGIKRLASRLGKRDGIRRGEALDAAAAQAGFPSYFQAHNQLARPPAVPQTYDAFISVYWAEARGREGQELLVVPLGKKLAELVTPRQLYTSRYFHGLKFVADDHLGRGARAKSQEEAREWACEAARLLTFLDVTGLKPSKSRARIYPQGKSANAVPRLDHYSRWYHRETGAYVLADEPYDAVGSSLEAERKAWAARHGWQVGRTSWAGMYRPGETLLYLTADGAKGFDLVAMIAALDRLPPAVVPETWSGRSLAFDDEISTPAGRTVRPPRPKPAKPRPKRGPTEWYVEPFSGRHRQKPSAAMPVEAHAEAGLLLRTVLGTDLPSWRLHDRLVDVRARLDEWAEVEYAPTGLDDETIRALYFGGPEARVFKEPDPFDAKAAIEQLQRVKAILQQHYRDCKPLRSVLSGIDKVIAKFEG
jgi:hypothetical protein